MLRTSVGGFEALGKPGVVMRMIVLESNRWVTGSEILYRMLQGGCREQEYHQPSLASGGRLT
jgi:hypothetical protein